MRLLFLGSLCLGNDFSLDCANIKATITIAPSWILLFYFFLWVGIFTVYPPSIIVLTIAIRHVRNGNFVLSLEFLY